MSHIVAGFCLIFAPKFFAATSWSEALPASTGTSQQARVLTPAGIQKEPLRGGDVNAYTLTLVAEQYVRLTIRRRGIDVKVKVTQPEDPTIREFDNPAGAESPIFVLLKAQQSGPRVIEIIPTRRWLPLGHYDIEVETVAFTPNNETRISAQSYMLEGRKQQRQDTDESRQLAVASYEKAFSLWTQLSDDFEAANTLQLMGQTFKALRDLERADINYKKALDLRVSDRQSRPYTLVERADAYYALKSPRASLPLYEEALTAFREVENRRGEALVLAQLGLVQMRLFNWDTARPMLESALAINRAEDDAYESMRVLNSLGGVYDNQSQPEKAMELFTEARDGFHALGDFAREGNIYINMGLHHDSWGEWREAIESYNKALELMELGLKNGDVDQFYVKSKKASIFFNLGALYVTLANYDEGRKYLQQSLELRTPNERATTLSWFGYAAVLAGEPKAALTFCQQALDLQMAAADPRRSQTYTMMGMAQHDLGNYDKAVEYFNLAFEIQNSKDIQDTKGLAITLDRRASSLAAKGQLIEARKDIERALAYWRSFKDPDGEAISLFQLAQIERRAGNVETALTAAGTAVKLAETLRRNLDDQRIRASYFATKVDFYDTYIDLLMSSHADVVKNTGTAFEASEQRRARVLLDTLSNSALEQRLFTDAKLSAFVKRQAELRRSIFINFSLRSEAIIKNNATRVAELDRQIASLSSERSNLESQIRTEYPEYAELMSPRPLATVEIQKQLDPDTLLLEFALGEKRSYAWVVTSEGIKGFELAPREQIEALATRLLQAITERNHKIANETPANTKARWDKADKEFADSAAALSKLIIAPIASALQRERLVVVADGALQLVPFGLLPDPTASSNLIAKHEIVSLPSASVLALQRQELANRKQAPLGVAVIADPVFELKDYRVAQAISKRRKRDPRPPPPISSTKTQNETLVSALRSVGADGGLHRLMMSRTEAAEIARVVPPDQIFEALDFEANRAMVMGGALSKYRYVHLATHGVIDLEHPELSGIVLSMVDQDGKEQDGYVRLYEIYNLNLPAELVVLSACQTGVGKQIRGEGLIALTRGFMYAGAARVVASLWKVDDTATAALMAQFYKEMFTNGKKPAAALRAAQQYMSDQKRWQSPYYWAGFVLQGEWR